MQKIKDKLPWILSAVLLFIIFLVKCGDGKTPVGKTTVKTDTIYTTKIVKIPEIKQVFIKEKPKPETEVAIGLTDTVRTYNNIFKDSTGLVEVVVKDSVNGHLLKQVVSFNVKEREIQYKEKTITNTITTKLKPSFVISGGLKTQIGLHPSVGAELTFKNKNGWSLDLGTNTNKDVLVGVKKDIITFYK
jgi:hypothetical protein